MFVCFAMYNTDVVFIERFHDFIDVYSPGTRADNPQNFDGI